MKRGPKAGGPAEKNQRGTFQPARHAGLAHAAAPDDLPVPPDWLTTRGRVFWADVMPKARLASGVCELDSTTLGNLANLLAALADAWDSGTAPPAAAIAEARRMCTACGINGALSRAHRGT